VLPLLVLLSLLLLRHLEGAREAGGKVVVVGGVVRREWIAVAAGPRKSRAARLLFGGLVCDFAEGLGLMWRNVDTGAGGLDWRAAVVFRRGGAVVLQVDGICTKGDHQVGEVVSDSASKACMWILPGRRQNIKRGRKRKGHAKDNKEQCRVEQAESRWYSPFLEIATTVRPWQAKAALAGLGHPK
jgi:hypothetical protein